MSLERKRKFTKKEQPSSLHPRVHELQEVWKKMEEEGKNEGIRYGLNPTSNISYNDWREMRESAAAMWAAFEYDALHDNRLLGEVDVKEAMALVLLGYRHELSFITDIAKRVDELLAKRCEGS